ncbi:hypothetical protein ACFQ0R_04975 [Psychroflexus salinarum]|uniref:Carboxypeptidase regulatory-like domain-containing protein n=1 Tax=Psychroflexus salinarum TaxID=546024 RepID=A0ABW3GTR7_9FLAO
MKQKVIEILKERSVIKKVILLAFLFIYTTINSQSLLSGNYSYCYGVTDNGECKIFSFKNNGVFQREIQGELGKINYGKGHYQIKNDSLILNYDLTELKINSFRKYKTYFNDSDSIKLYVRVFSHSEKVRPNVSVLNLKDRYGEVTDKDGLAVLSFKKQAGSKKIQVSDLCCGNYSFEIDTKLNYEIEVYLSEGYNKPKAIKNQIEKYKIMKLNKNQLKLKEGEQIITLKKKS